MWNFHVDYYAKGGYVIILGIYLLTDLGLNLKLSEHVIEENDGTFKGLAAPMVDMGTFEFKYLNSGKITHEELFKNYYAE